jgi:hypothetical protein
MKKVLKYIWARSWLCGILLFPLGLLLGSIINRIPEWLAIFLAIPILLLGSRFISGVIWPKSLPKKEKEVV